MFLDIACNKLSSLQGLKDLQQLLELNLSENRLTRIGNMFLSYVYTYVRMYMNCILIDSILKFIFFLKNKLMFYHPNLATH